MQNGRSHQAIRPRRVIALVSPWVSVDPMPARFVDSFGLIVLAAITLVAAGCATAIDIDLQAVPTAPSEQVFAEPVMGPGQCFAEEELGFCLLRHTTYRRVFRGRVA